MKKIHFLTTIVILLLGSEHIQAQWIEPAQYQQMLGRGMDVDWWTNNNNYSQPDFEHAIADFKDAGIQHIRITLTKEYLSPEDFDMLDEQINQCINYGVTPIIAYKPAYGRFYPSYERRISNWWRTIAQHYRNYPACLSFDILLEPNNSMFASYSDLNNFYEDCVTSIRLSNPYRIIFIAPIDNSDPLYLQYLRIPSQSNGYLMAEWHFFSEPNYNRFWYNWQNRRAYEERLIKRRIEAALVWQRHTGIYTWVGGWAPGSYFNTNYSSIQDAFTSFLCNALVVARIPFAVRGINHYYDYSNRVWHKGAYNNMHTIFPKADFAHSGVLVDRPNLNTGFHIAGRRFGNSDQHDNSANIYHQGNSNNQNYSNKNGSESYNNNFNSVRIHTGGNGRYNDKHNIINNLNDINSPNNKYTSPNNRSSYSSDVHTPSHQSRGSFSENRVFQGQSNAQPNKEQPNPKSQQSSPSRKNTTQQKDTKKQATPPQRNGGGGFSRN